MKDSRKRRLELPTVIFLCVMLAFPGDNLKAQEKPAAPVDASSRVNASAASKPQADTGLNQSLPFIHEIKDSAWLKPTDSEKGELALVAGRSQLLRLERPIARVSVSNPAIVDAVIISPNELLLNAKGEGAVNIIFWDHQNRVGVYDITVTKDPNLLQAVLQRISPTSHFDIYPSNDVYVVKGDVDSVAKQKEVEQAANAFAEGSVSLVRVQDAKQVLLKARFIQLDHTQDYDFGVDFQYLGRNMGPLLRPGGTGGTIDTSSTFTPRNSVVGYNTLSTVPSASGVHYFPYFTRDYGINTFVKAIETRGIGKIIARPNILATDGQEASFLVGGEAAVVAISNDNVGVQYKEFGTRLTFTPEILPSGKIRLTVAPEVSALDFANGVSVNNVTIPSFTTVRTKTVVELEDNETFMIGGLLQQKITVDERGVPFLRRMPLIGKMFDNTNNSYSDSELLVVVTPAIVNPTKEPLSEDPDSDGLIEQASKQHPYRVKDKNMEAIDKYLKENRKSLQEQIKKFQENKPEPENLPEIQTVKLEVKETPSSPVPVESTVQKAAPKAEAPKPEPLKTAVEPPSALPKTLPPAVVVKSTVEVKAAAQPPAPPMTSAPKSAAAPVEEKKTTPPAPAMTASAPKSLDALEAELKWQNQASAAKSETAQPVSSSTDKKTIPAVSAQTVSGEKKS